MQILDWAALDTAARTNALKRPALNDSALRASQVQAIIQAVRNDGDAALRTYAERFDNVVLDALTVPVEEIDAAEKRLDVSVRAAIDRAFDNLCRFHEPSGQREYAVETAPGVQCRKLVRPLGAVGLYVPGGSAPLPSTALMLGVPAMLAGCETRVLCTPPDRNGNVAAEILYAAKRCGITRVIRTGGAQAIAAMAYGTASVPRVDRIFGPGNTWVTEAKRQVAQDVNGALIDMPAGPSEVLVIADEGANAAFIAADLLSQAEHGPDSQVLLLTPSRMLARDVQASLQVQLETLARASVARQSLRASRILIVESLNEALEISNTYAPEHLILNVDNAEALLGRVTNAGSVFLGAWTPESLGDYISGTNHVLPTYGYARQLGGLCVADFQKGISVQCASADGLRELGQDAIALAKAEGLDAHANAVAMRLGAMEVRRERA